MKKNLIALAVFALCASFAYAGPNYPLSTTFSTGKTKGGVKNSAHNMSYSQATTAGLNASQICQFCHTPHNSIADAGTPTEEYAALWNHYVNQSQTYTLWGTDSNSYPGLLAGPSLTCLSCHDGTIAISDLKNPIWQTQTGSALVINKDDGHIASDFTLKLDANGAGPVLGTDLTNDHPVGAAPSTRSSFNQNWRVAPTGTGNWSYPGVSGMPTNGYTVAYTGSTMTIYPNGDTLVMPSWNTAVKMYKSNLVSNMPSVQCRTCHNPHNAGYSKMLVMNNDQSALCYNCHWSR